jgi:hypothetical protein
MLRRKLTATTLLKANGYFLCLPQSPNHMFPEFSLDNQCDLGPQSSFLPILPKARGNYCADLSADYSQPSLVNTEKNLN